LLGGAGENMKSKEKILTNNKEKVDIIKNYIDEKIKQSEGDITPSPLRMVSRELIISEAEELFKMFANGEFEAAGPKLKVVLEKISEIKDETILDSNLKFVRSFDHEIEKAIEIKQTEEFKAQNNG
jgi:hypothetical protein